MALTTPAEVAYAAYGNSTGGRNHQGLPMPVWTDLPDQSRQAWAAAATAVATTSTQARYPWRAVARTILAALVALLVIAPQVLFEAGLGETAYGAQAIAVMGTVTRVLALPGVDGWLRQHLPWLASAPARHARL